MVQSYSVMIYTADDRIVFVEGFTKDTVDAFVDEIADAMVEGDIIDMAPEGGSYLDSPAHYVDDPEEIVAFIDPGMMGITSVVIVKDGKEEDEKPKLKPKLKHENCISTEDDEDDDDIAHVFAHSIPIYSGTVTYTAIEESEKERKKAKDKKAKARKKLVEALTEIAEECGE